MCKLELEELAFGIGISFEGRSAGLAGSRDLSGRGASKRGDSDPGGGRRGSLKK